MDQREFEAVYRRYFDPVYRYALSLTRDASQAEELTQRTFFKALENIDRFRGESTVYSWLCAIARNAFLSDRRKMAPEPLEELPERANDSAGPEEQTLEREETIRLHRALHALPEPYREVFTLRVFAQLSFREIGGLFAKTDNWACVVYHRARAMLRKKEESQ